MSHIVSITSQGQINLPAKLRREIGLQKPGRAFISAEKGKIIVEPVKDILELAGSLKTNKKPLTNREMRELIASEVAREYGLTLKKIK